MSSGFVSGGTADAPIERSQEWLAAQKEIEANSRRKLDEQARQSDGRSLYETLEANKAAKQDAFEEANRLKNQFRALDEDEIEFLDSVLESTRVEEERVKKETAEGLALFRKQQEEADRKARRGSGGTSLEEDEPSAETTESWATVGKKRKRVKEKEGNRGFKVRRGSMTTTKSSPPITKPSAPETPEAVPGIPGAPDSKPPATTKPSTRNPRSDVSKQSPTTSKGGLGLVAYGSDSDDD